MEWSNIPEEIAEPMALSVKLVPKERDNELLSAIATGSRHALEELYLHYHRRLARYLSRFTRYETAEEIINDTFMVVWQSAKGFRSESLVSTWIIGIAYRTALKALREQKRFSATTGGEDLPEPRSDPTRDTETQDWLAHGLSQLPPKQRLTLELAYHMGHSMEEISAITGAPVGTVKARMFHAREKLRQSLAESGGKAVSEPAARLE